MKVVARMVTELVALGLDTSNGFLGCQVGGDTGPIVTTDKKGRAHMQFFELIKQCICLATLTIGAIIEGKGYMLFVRMRRFLKAELRDLALQTGYLFIRSSGGDRLDSKQNHSSRKKHVKLHFSYPRATHIAYCLFLFKTEIGDPILRLH